MLVLFISGLQPVAPMHPQNRTSHHSSGMPVIVDRGVPQYVGTVCSVV